MKFFQKREAKGLKMPNKKQKTSKTKAADDKSFDISDVNLDGEY